MTPNFTGCLNCTTRTCTGRNSLKVETAPIAVSQTAHSGGTKRSQKNQRLLQLRVASRQRLPRQPRRRMAVLFSHFEFSSDGAGRRSFPLGGARWL